MFQVFGIPLSTILAWAWCIVLYVIFMSMLGRVIHHGNGGDEER